ncbi:MAG: prepilin-type N-terminal cleavage/methylation domain-containing protein [Lachnospiraceae bacterium]|nr:prepilin-type N-terminal cleavage/methylation domain-containing protein [Candidatus Colinaster scatohippi]
MKTRHNNKGFSLIELIVAFAIFAVVGTAITGFIFFSNNSFSSANKNLKLQYDQQVVVNRIRDIIVETSRGINYNPSTNTLIVLSDNQGDDKETLPYSVARIRYDSSEKKLYLLEENIAAVDSIKSIAFSKAEGVLCDTIGTEDGSKKAFNVNLDEVDAGKVTLDIIFMVGEKEVEVHPVINLRNMIRTVGEEEELGELYKGIVEEHFTSVASVVIVRDGKKFSQGRTDTIAMAGDDTTVDYDAIVTKKKTVKDSIDTSVTWEIELSTIKDKYKYASDGITPVDTYKMCISIDAGSGAVHLRNAVMKDELGNNVTITPADVINGDYFIIKAISNQDPTKVARLRIKVTTGGVYPVSIKTTLTPDSPIVDLINQLATFRLTHSITYTDKIKDPATGAMVNPLEGEGAYSKVHYDVYEDAALTKEATLKPGSGFTNVGGTDGKFVVTKSMCGKTFYIANTLFQKDKNGQIVRDVFVLTIPKDLIGDKVDATVPSLNSLDEHLRADYNPASANWSKGTPEYVVVENGKEVNKKYEYRYEWKLVPLNEGAFTKWGEAGSAKNPINDRNAFVDASRGNIYFKDASKGQDTVVHDSLNRIALVYCEPKLDWGGTFQYKIELRVQLTGNGRSGYYRLPVKDEHDNLDYLTTNVSDAYVAEKIVVINPVTLTLEYAPDGTVFYDYPSNDNKKPIDVIFDNGPIVHLGKKEVYKEWGPVWDPNAWGPGLGGDIWKELTKVRSNPGEYYKIFVPTFTGIKVYDLNYDQILDIGEGNSSPIRKTFSDGSSTLVPYYKNGDKYDYDNKNRTGFSTGLKVQYDKLYFYLSLKPIDWENTDKFPVGCKWTCVLGDRYGNMVRAIFEETGSDFINYTIHHAYEGDCSLCH